MLLFNKPTAISYISKSGDKIYPVVIDIKEGVKSSETLSFMTADSNTGILSVAFMEGETIYNIDGATVVCDIERPDGTDLSIGAVKVADGVVEVPLGVNGTSQPGMYMFDFKIVRPGSKTIGVPLVSYTVTQSINTDEIVTQDDRLPVLNDLIVKIQNATSASTQATNECKTATNNSIQATNNANNTLRSVNNAIASGTVDLELKQLRTSLNGTLHPTANDRINQMETHLLEATATTIETESSFTTVDATSNGYFEDVKLEGRTLVNLGGIVKNKSCVKWQKLKSYNATIGKTYTSIIKNTGEVRLDFKNSILNTLITKVEPNDTISISFVCADSEISVVNSVEGVCGFEWILLEGDHTNNPPEYFEGLMSVGQDVEEVSVESRNRNRLHISENFDWKYGTAPKVVDNVLYGGWAIGYKVYLEKGDYVLSCNRQTTDNSTPNALLVKVKDASTNTVVTSFSLGTLGELLGNFTVSHNSEYIIMLDNQANVPASVISDIQLCRTGVHTEYTQHQYNKKPLLYFNPTTETWEKPVLREWDTIEKHSDGKYYYHKRSKEVVLNGSEDWSKYNTLNHINTFGAMTRFNDVENVTGANCMVDIIPKQPSTQVSMLDEEGLYLRGDSKLCYIKILRSKLSTQDIAGFKAWLKANPTTVVYELLQEEVYECTNIDLMTYSGETNYIINSGAISPKSLLKVHNNISNVVKILQEKVSLLENTFIAGLKSVLSGDMYSLATILYPEDFEQNDNTEQDIMVIPE